MIVLQGGELEVVEISDVLGETVFVHHDADALRSLGQLHSLVGDLPEVAPAPVSGMRMGPVRSLPSASRWKRPSCLPKAGKAIQISGRVACGSCFHLQVGILTEANGAVGTGFDKRQASEYPSIQ